MNRDAKRAGQRDETALTGDKKSGAALRGIEDALPIALLRTREEVMARFRPHLHQYDITEQQWRVIRVLHTTKGTDATSLASLCCILMPSLSRILKALEARGLINRIKTPDDGRRQLIKLSDQGHDLFNAMWERSAEIYREIEDECGKDLIEDVLDRLKHIQIALHT